MNKIQEISVQHFHQTGDRIRFLKASKGGSFYASMFIYQ